MPALRKFVNGRTYECRPAENGVYYIHWSEGRRSYRKSTREKDVRCAQAFFDEFVKYARAEGVSVLTIRDLWTLRYPSPPVRYEACWNNLEPHFGDLRPSEMTPEIEDAYKVHRAGIAPSTLRLELSLVRAAINHGVKKRRISAMDVPLLDPLPAQSPPRDRWLSDDEVKRLFAAAESNRRTFLFLWLALETGARRTAIQDLKWDQVDWEINTVHFLPPGQKQSRKRKASVPISGRLRPVLERAFAEKLPNDDFVIGAGAMVNQAVHSAARRAGIEGVTPHVLRHTAATRMARGQVSLFHIAKVLGNTVEQVEKTYAHWQPQMLQGAVNTISGER